MADQYDPLAPRPDGVTDALNDIRHEFAALDLRPIGITIAILTVFLLGHFIILPALNFDMIRDQVSFGGSPDRFSIMALGALPWAIAVAIVELVGVIIWPLRRLLGFRDGHCNPFNRFVIFLGFCLAAVQAYSVTVALISSDLVTVSSNIAFLLTITSLVSGTTLCVVFARLIDRYGTGHGFWLVFGFSLPFAFPFALKELFEKASTGAITLRVPLLIELATLVVVTLVIVVIARQLFNAGVKSAAPLVLPILVANQAASFLLIGIYTATIGTSFEPSQFIGNGIYYLSQAILLVVFLALSLRSYLRWRTITFAIVGLTLFTYLPTLFAATEAVPHNGWIWYTGAAQAVAFIASLVFIVSGVYGRRSVVGNP